MGKLEGARVVVTRPAAPDDRLGERLAAAGARVLRFPALAVEPLATPLPSGGFDWAIFISPAAVAHGFRRLAADVPPHLAAVGRGTARRLEAAGATGVLVPPTGAGMQALLTGFGSKQLAGCRVLLVGGEPLDTRGVAALAALGAAVTPFPVYRRRAVADPEPLAGWLRRGAADAIIVSSVAAVTALAALPGVALGEVAWICSGPRVAVAVEQAGGQVAAVAASADDEDLTAAAIRWWQAEGR